MARETLQELGATELPDGSLAFPGILPRRLQSEVPQEAQELCELLGVQQLVRVRTTGEGKEKLFSLVDIARLVSGKEARHAAEDVAEVKKQYAALTDSFGQFKFPGERQRTTPVADLRTTLLVVLRLRSRQAKCKKTTPALTKPREPTQAGRTLHPLSR